MNASKIKYRPEIDGLRAIAVITVIFYHFEISFFGNEFFKGGYLGVDVFFVISGYLITSILVDEYQSKKSISILNFYKRRIRRIIPLLFTVILVCIPFAWFYLIPSSLIDFSKSSLSSLIFSSNFYFHFSENAYFNFNDSNPLLHTWSLSVEEQFYIFFPFFLLFIIKFSKKLLKQIIISLILINLLIIQLGGNLSFVYPYVEESFSFDKQNFFGSFYIFTSRFWELLVGSSLVFFQKKKVKYNIIFTIFPKIGLVIIIFSVYFFSEKTFHPSFYTLIPVVGVCLIIFFSNKLELTTRLLSSKVFVKLGLISYSLYLWHYPFLIFQKNIFEKENNLLCFFLILLTSIFSYLFVEKPFRNKSKTSFKQAVIFISSVTLIISLFSINTLINKGHEKRFNSEVKNYFLDNKYYSDEWSSEQKKYFGSKQIQNFEENKINILIIGNSHGQDLFNLFYFQQDLYTNYDIKYSITRGGDDLLNFFKNSDGCNFYRKNLIPLISNYSDKDNQKICNADYLIISNRYNDWDLAYLKQIYEISKKIGKELVLVKIKPHFNIYGTSTIIDKFVIKNKSLPNKDTLKTLEKKYFISQKSNKYINDMNLKLLEFSKKNKLKILDVSDLFCDQASKRCEIFTNNSEKIVYDSSHFSIEGAKYLGKKAFYINWLESVLK
mgnify:CR=1 FL=1